MLEIILILISVLCLGSIIIALIWSKVKFGWLASICSAIVISLPFERVPSISLAGVNIRASQLLVLAGLLVLIILVIKKDKLLLAQRINQFSWIIPVFIVTTIPSWFVAVNPTRFLSTTIATWIALGALFLISNFTVNLWRQLQNLILSIFAAGVFGFYQFVGDLFLNLPTYLTGLREQYTKAVFGYPRIQATALEPLYFAGMLFVPIILSALMILNGRKFEFGISRLWFNRYLRWTQNPIALLTFFTVLFVLTISKGAWASLALALIPFLVLNYGLFIQMIQRALAWIKSTYTRLGGSGVSLVLAVTAIFLVLFGGSIIPILTTTANHLLETLTGEAGTIIERQAFVSAALEVLPDNSLLGIGSGQYGVYARELIPNTSPEGFLIVNNVYLEVWLEQGFLALAVFGLMIFLPVWKSILEIFSASKHNIVISKEQNNNLITQQALTFGLIAYLIQWTTFSPIFIMPIFILLGLLTNIQNKHESIEAK